MQEYAEQPETFEKKVQKMPVEQVEKTREDLLQEYFDCNENIRSDVLLQSIFATVCVLNIAVASTNSEDAIPLLFFSVPYLLFILTTADRQINIKNCNTVIEKHTIATEILEKKESTIEAISNEMPTEA